MLGVHLPLSDHGGVGLRQLGLLAKVCRLTRLDDAGVVTKLEYALVLGELLAQLRQREESLSRMRCAVLFVH